MMKDKFLDWLCSSRHGFWLAYKLGLARPGIDFIVCGQEDDHE